MSRATRVDRDTYHLFGLNTGVPADTYGLEEAVADGYLVPPRRSRCRCGDGLRSL